MAISLEETTLFSTPIYAAVLSDINNSAAAKELYSVYVSDDKGRDVSNSGGWQSNDLSGVMGDLPEIGAITDLVTMAATEIFMKWKIRDTEAIASGVWGNINGDGDYNKSHVHPLTIMSACYYISAAENSGAILFERPDNQGLYFHSEYNDSPYTAREIGVEPYDGLLLVFPSYLSHYVLPNRSGEDRMSLAFNFI